MSYLQGCFLSFLTEDFIFSIAQFMSMSWLQRPGLRSLGVFNQILALWLHPLPFCNFDKDTNVSRTVIIKREKLKVKQKKSLVPKLHKRLVHFCLLKSKAYFLSLATWLVCVTVLCPCSCCSTWIHLFLDAHFSLVHGPGEPSPPFFCNAI